MNKSKRVLAILGVILLVGMYGATLVFAMIDSPGTYGMFKVFLYADIAVPVLIYAMILVYRRLKDKNKEMYGSRIDTVILDVGNVLVDYDWKRYLGTFHFDEKTEKKIAAAVFEHPLWEEADRGVLSFEELTEGFVKNCPELGTEIRRVYERLGDTIFPLDYACGWVRELKSKGLKVYILSNYSRRMFEQTKDKMEFLALTDGALFSFECHMIKPETEIYEELIRRYRIRPERAVFIDDRQKNVDGAKEAGLLGLRFTDYQDTRRALERLLCKNS